DEVDFRCTSSYRTDKAADGRKVVQMMFNSQNGDGDWNGNGGDCWLRILEFKPDGKTIGVRTFSPLFALSKLTKHLVWRTADYDQFEIVLE
ncbi:MAG: serine/threonine protein phosphatase, partial [Bacteroidaceae bacterium]|nr:serine/threonine protein phosphatase [Bacteroidaceae bacterium]